MTRLISFLAATLLATAACGSQDPLDDDPGEDTPPGEENPPGEDGPDAAAGLSLILDAASLEGRVGNTETVTFTVVGAGELDGDITVKALDLPAGITAGDVILPAGTTDGALVLSVSASALAGVSHSIVLEASTDLEAATAPVELFVVGRAGTPDVTFGEVGKVSLSGSAGLEISSAVVAGDESIVLGGTIGFSRFVVLKLTALGDPDPSFGVDGRVEVSFADRQMTAVGGGVVTVQSDGAIVVAGHGIATQGSASNALLVARLTGAGALDATFASGGRISRTFGARGFRARALALGPDDSLNIAGCAVDNALGSDRGVVRLRRDGQLDGAFGSGGLFVQPTPALACLGDIQVRADGSSVAIDGGAVISIGANGSPDVLFGVDGVGAIDAIAAGFDIAADGAILVGGTDSFDIGAIGRPTITRVVSSGVVDASFGSGGNLFPVSGNGRVHFVHSGAAEILAVVRFDLFGDAAVIRLGAGGEPDPSFGTGGQSRLASPGAMLESAEVDHSRLLVITSTSVFRLWR